MKTIGIRGLLLAVAMSWPVSASAAKIVREIKPDREGNVVIAKSETVEGDVSAHGAIIVEGKINGDVSSLGGAITITGEVQGDVAALGDGNISVLGKVGGDISSAGSGMIDVMGTVSGDISAMGGSVRLGGKSVVGGDIALLGGELQRAEGAKVGGEITNIAAGAMKNLQGLNRNLKALDLPAKVERTAEALAPAARVAGFIGFLMFLAGIGALVVLLVAFLPKSVGRLTAAIKADFWSSCGVGLLVLMALFPCSLLLVISILGIPLLPLAAILIWAASMLGIAAFGALLTERLYESLQKPQPGPVASAAVGYGLLVALLVVGKMLNATEVLGSAAGGTLMLAGLMLMSCALMAGLGAAWTTRLGTR